MNNLEQNALRIAELLSTFMFDGCIKPHSIEYAINERIRCIECYSSYNGLMPIVFESKKSRTYTIDILAVSVVLRVEYFMNESEVVYGKSFDANDKQSFIEALQLACIKYLELKS